MKYLGLFILFINSFNLFAQVDWAPVGAIWHFNQPSSTEGNYITFESKKDSTIKEKSVRVIEVKLNGTTLISREYIRQNKDSIFYYNTNSNMFYLLYNFSAKAGDTIVVHNNKFKPTKAFFSYYDSIANFKYKIISIDSIKISDIWLKRQKVASLKNSAWNFFNGMSSDYYIIEKSGSLTYFFGRSINIIPEEQPTILRCYNEPGFAYKNPIWGLDCDIITSIYEQQMNNSIRIYPNPFNDLLSINTNEPIESLEIFDITGSKRFVESHKNRIFSIDLSSFSQGVYFIMLKTTRKIYVRKIVKQ